MTRGHVVRATVHAVCDVALVIAFGVLVNRVADDHGIVAAGAVTLCGVALVLAARAVARASRWLDRLGRWY